MFSIQKKLPTSRVLFISFDGGVVADGFLQRPDRYRFWMQNGSQGYSIPRGAGLSYAAASFSQGGISVEHRFFNRILDFDSEKNVVEVEAGIELSALHDFLSCRGLYLPIQPGHGRITVGGCIAADVHGKNQAKDGTFINQVVALTLFHPNHGVIEIFPESEPELFRLTCGGYGLTGHIIRAKLHASPIPSFTLEAIAIPVSDVYSGINYLVRNALEADMAYSWHDFTLKGSSFGRGYIYLARFTSEKSLEPLRFHHRTNPPALSSTKRISWNLPMLNRITTPILNFLYSRNQGFHGQLRLMNLYDILFPIHKTQFYFNLFGVHGFHEYQIVIPADRTQNYLDAVQDYINKHSIPVTLASAKLFSGTQDLLRFTGEGTCFALNFPRTQKSSNFLIFLDNLLMQIGGIPNIIKDSRLPRSVVDSCYPEADLFRRQLYAFDSKRVFRSELSERLGL